MQYRLRSLVLLSAIGPPVLALAYWGIKFAMGGGLRIQIYLAFLALSVYCCIAGWSGLNQMLFGPTPMQSWQRFWRRKRRQRIRVRI